MINRISRENIVMLDYTQESQNLHLHHKFFCSFDGTELAEIRYNFHPKKPFAVMSDFDYITSKQFEKYNESVEYVHNCLIDIEWE